ncbi:hypothetical protein L8106_25987 [Lyngbya sp. PCC 8106]|nr:hypothetical protein L8106_25987 [Lyngbya sp. PCC 8106]
MVRLFRLNLGLDLYGQVLIREILIRDILDGWETQKSGIFSVYSYQ